MGSAMRLRTLFELLAALVLTFAALAAVSKMAKTTGMNVEKAYARASTGAIYLTLDNAGSEHDGLCCVATNAALCAAGIGSPYSDA
jgi:copper(I)-binding protein